MSNFAVTLLQKINKHFDAEDVEKITKAIPSILNKLENKLLPGFKTANDQADWIVKKLKEIGKLDEKATWNKLSNLIDFVKSIEKDWREIAKAKSIDDFLTITHTWNSSRRGYAFEYWIRENKALKELSGGEYSGFTKWENLTVNAKDLGVSFATKSGTRRSDRYIIKASGGRIWDYKHYKSWQGGNSFKKQLDDYIKTMTASTEHKGLVYLFSTEKIAKTALSDLTQWIAKATPSNPINKTINILFVDGVGNIRRLKKFSV